VNNSVIEKQLDNLKSMIMSGCVVVAHLPYRMDRGLASSSADVFYLQTFVYIEQFKAELLDYLDYYNNRSSKVKLMGLPPAVHRQQALSIA